MNNITLIDLLSAIRNADERFPNILVRVSDEQILDDTMEALEDLALMEQPAERKILEACALCQKAAEVLENLYLRYTGRVDDAEVLLQEMAIYRLIIQELN